MKISLKFLEICSNHVFFVISTGFFSGFILIVLNFWSARKNHIGKKMPTWYNYFTFHVGNHVDICRMPMWVRKTASTTSCTEMTTTTTEEIITSSSDAVAVSPNRNYHSINYDNSLVRTSNFSLDIVTCWR